MVFLLFLLFWNGFLHYVNNVGFCGVVRYEMLGVALEFSNHDLIAAYFSIRAFDL